MFYQIITIKIKRTYKDTTTDKKNIFLFLKFSNCNEANVLPAIKKVPKLSTCSPNKFIKLAPANLGR